MQNASRTLLLLWTVTLTLPCISAASLPRSPLTEEETVHAYLGNGGHALIQKALNLPEGVYYNPLAHFSRDDAPLPKSPLLSRQLDTSTPSNIELLRSLGYYLPGLDDESLLHDGHLHRMHTVSRQTGGDPTIVRGIKSVFSVAYEGGPPEEARRAFERALKTWADTFECKVILRVRFKWKDLGGRTLAAANSPFSVLGRGSSQLKYDTAYTPTMAAAISGRDFFPNRYHIEIAFNSRQTWHYNLRRRAPRDKLTWKPSRA